MAQKKRKEEEKKEPQYEFVPPSFDEKDFLEKDIKGNEDHHAVFPLGTDLWHRGRTHRTPFRHMWVCCCCFVGIYLMKFFYQAVQDRTREIDKKGWLGNIAMFFFLFLGTWIMLLNPPFT